MRRTLAPTTFLCFLALGAIGAGAADWLQIRGQNRDGRSPETGLARAWPAEGPRLVWRRPIGEGYSGLAIVGDRVFTADSDGKEEFALCLDAASGALQWKVPIGAYFTEEFGNGPRSTPTVDGSRVFVVGSTSRLFALATADGKVLWELDLPKALGAVPPGRGFSASPLVDGEQLILEIGGDQGIVALDKSTGKTLWRAEVNGPGGYSSPIRVTLAGVPQYVFYRRSAPQLVSLGLDGKVLWTREFSPTGIAMPLHVPPDGVFFSASHDEIDTLVRVVPGATLATEEAWKHNRMRNHFNAALVDNGTLYGFDNATFRSLEAATGAAGWAQRGFGKGSLVAADGLLFVLSDLGVLALVEADAKEYKERGRVQALTGKSWTAPSLAGGRIYLRDQDEIVCYDVSPSGVPAPAAG